MDTYINLKQQMSSLGRTMARILAVILGPALAASIYRAVVSDGAVGIVILQIALYLLLLLMCLRTERISYKARFGTFALIGLLVGVGAFFRNQDVGVSYAYALMATLFLSMMLARTHAILTVCVVMGGIAAASLFAGYYPVERVIGHLLGMVGMSVVMIYFVTSMIAGYENRANTESRLRLERDSALAELRLEMQRRQAVSETASVAFLDYDFESGRCYGDSTELGRHGLPEEAQYWDTATDMELFPIESQEIIQAKIADLANKPCGTVEGFTLQMHVRPSNELRTFRVSGMNVDKAGKKIFAGASIDVTAEHQSLDIAKRQSQQLELMALAGKVGFFEVDLTEGSMRGNAVLMAREGLPPTAVVSMQAVAGRVPEAERESFNKNVQKAIEAGPGAVTTFTHPYVTANGERIQVRVVATTELHGTRLVALGASIDITDELNAKSRAELAAKRLEAHQDKQAQMYAVIGHELRTPAASLQMMLEDLGEGESIDSTLARTNIEQLLSVIDTLRAVAQPGRMAQSAFVDVQLDEILLQQVQSFGPMAQRQEIRLRTDLSGLSGHMVHIQKSLLLQIVSNLIKNAMIHSQGSEILVGAKGSVIDSGQEHLRIWIEDNGKGVPLDKVDSLFEAFVRGSTEAEGTGLGLHVCREIAQNMGGGLRYEPNPEGGSRFVIELDVSTVDSSVEPIEAQAQPQTSPLEGLHILLAEDNKTIQMLTQKMLTKQGARVQVCNNGAEALAAYEPDVFDLVLSDIFMPEMNGYEFVAALRQRGFSGRVIGLTAATIGEETERMLNVGADAVLSKPINLGELKANLSAHKQVDSLGVG